jgi:hypothetical protein
VLIPNAVAVALMVWWLFNPFVFRSHSLYTEMMSFNLKHLTMRVRIVLVIFLTLVVAAISTYFTGDNPSLLSIIWLICFNQCHVVIMAAVSSTPSKTSTQTEKVS